MSVLKQYFSKLDLNVNPVQMGEVIIILAIVAVAVYVFYSLNLFRKER